MTLKAQMVADLPGAVLDGDLLLWSARAGPAAWHRDRREHRDALRGRLGCPRLL